MSAFFVSVGTSASVKSFGDPNALDAKTQLAAYGLRNAALGTTKALAGIGDGAVLGTAGIAAYAGDRYVEILRVSLTDDQLVEIAKQVIGNL